MMHLTIEELYDQTEMLFQKPHYMHWWSVFIDQLKTLRLQGIRMVEAPGNYPEDYRIVKELFPSITRNKVKRLREEAMEALQSGDIEFMTKIKELERDFYHKQVHQDMFMRYLLVMYKQENEHTIVYHHRTNYRKFDELMRHCMMVYISR